MTIYIRHRTTNEVLFTTNKPHLRQANLYQANLCEADLRRADLREANLYQADLRRATLSEADLYQANLYQADLRGANLREADLREADLCEADLRETNLYQANLRGARHIINAGFDLRGYCFLGQSCKSGVLIIAGCRHFESITAARAHWETRHSDRPELQAECLAKVTLIETVAMARGWVKERD